MCWLGSLSDMARCRSQWYRFHSVLSVLHFLYLFPFISPIFAACGLPPKPERVDARSLVAKATLYRQ